MGSVAHKFRSMMMQVRALVSPPALEQIALHSTLGAIILWSGVLYREWPTLAAGGVLCGEPNGLLGHCALCWPAAALTGIALATLALAARATARRS